MPSEHDEWVCRSMRTRSAAPEDGCPPLASGAHALLEVLRGQRHRLGQGLPLQGGVVRRVACVGECQLPPVVSWILWDPSGDADHTLPWSMYTIESAFAAAST